MTQKPYRYAGCGLDWVYLLDGYDVHETPYGCGVSVRDADGLHEAIAQEIVTSHHPIRGQEMRFLRSILDVSQDGMGKMIGLSRVQVSRCENKPDEAVSGSVDRALRMLFGLREQKPDLIERILEVLTEIDAQEHEPATFTGTHFGWAKAA